MMYIFISLCRSPSPFFKQLCKFYLYSYTTLLPLAPTKLQLFIIPEMTNETMDAAGDKVYGGCEGPDAM